MRKRLLIIPLLLALLSGLVFPVAAAFSDIDGLPCKAAVEKIVALGIVEGRSEGTFAPEEKLTRAEMATIILRMRNVTASETSQIFTDVSADHWAYATVGTAYQLGFVKGTSATTFAPDEEVTYPQAIKMLVCALGYGVKAEDEGGYPTGYLSVASEIGVLDGLHISEGPITRATMAMLVANAVDADILIRTGAGADYTVKTEEGVTVLTEYLHIQKYVGKITSNGMITLDGPSVKKGEVALDGKVFAAGTSKAADFIGKMVTLYAKDTDLQETVLYVEARYGSDTLTVDAADISPESTLTKLYYYDKDGREKNANISSSAVWIYNGVKKTDMTPADLIFKTGTVELISSGGSSADTVVIRSFKNLIVDSVRPEEYKIIFKDRDVTPTTLTLDPEDSSYRFTFVNDDGTSATPESCKEWDVLSVAIAGNESVIEVIRGTKVIAGKVSEMGKDTATIEGTTYKIAANILDSTNMKKPEIAMEANFNLDFMGRIAAVDNENYRSTKYGYLVSGEKTKGLNSVEQLKIYTEDGLMKIFTVAENCKLNNNPVRDGLLSSSVIYSGGAVVEQLVLFRANAADEILEIETATDNTDGHMTEEQRLATFSEDFYKDRIGIIGYESKIFATRYLVRENTKIFIVPENYTGEDKFFSMRAWSDVGHVGAGGTYNGLSLYDINEDNTVSVMVSRDTVSAIPTGRVGVITEISETLSAEGENRTKLTVMEKNGTVEMLTAADLGVITELVLSDPTVDPMAVNNVFPATVAADVLEVGDVVQYDLSTLTGEATAMRVLFRNGSPLVGERAFNDAGKKATTSADTDYVGSVYAYAKVDRVSEYGARIYVPGGRNNSETYERIRHFNDTKLILFDSDRDTFKEITSAEIYEDDYIFAFKVNASEQIIVVYR
ncbi:MAG: S-layer homology domain-containing protein [Clostridia bacterium]|nr:S-layer homology domain-containing protein [Clostridia bacterium]